MDRPEKKQKVEDDSASLFKEEILFNTDTLPKIISYLPSNDLLNLALTCRRFGSAPIADDNNEVPSLVEESARIAIQDIATEAELAALPFYDGTNALEEYHYLQFLRGPLTFDQLVGGAEYVNSGDKTCIRHSGTVGSSWETAFSNNILCSGKHYVTFTPSQFGDLHCFLGVMRPGKANQNANGSPLFKQFYRHFSRIDSGGPNDNIDCCLCSAFIGSCHLSNWTSDTASDSNGRREWDGMERISDGDELGLLLDLDEGTLSVYKNGRKLGIMKRGLEGSYCWVVTMLIGVQVTIKRGTIPSS